MGFYYGIEEEPTAKLCSVVEQHSRRVGQQVYAEAAIKL